MNEKKKNRNYSPVALTYIMKIITFSVEVPKIYRNRAARIRKLDYPWTFFFLALHINSIVNPLKRNMSSVLMLQENGFCMCGFWEFSSLFSVFAWLKVVATKIRIEFVKSNFDLDLEWAVIYCWLIPNLLHA